MSYQPKVGDYLTRISPIDNILIYEVMVLPFANYPKVSEVVTKAIKGDVVETHILSMSNFKPLWVQKEERYYSKDGYFAIVERIAWSEQFKEWMLIYVLPDFSIREILLDKFADRFSTSEP